MIQLHRPGFGDPASKLSVRVSSLLALLLLCCVGVGPAAQFALNDGDRVVFYGDEITAVQFYDNALEPRLYPTFVESFVATRFPKLHVEFVDSAWNGDRVSGGAGGPIQLRLRRDVIPFRPTVVTIMLGMNDARTTAFNPQDHEAYTTGYDIGIHPAAAIFDEQRYTAYTHGFEHLVEALKHEVPDVRITLLKPSPYVEMMQPRKLSDFNRVLLKYGEYIDAMAERDHLTVVDANSALVKVVRSAYIDNPAVTRNIIPDGMNPAAAGHLVIAKALLKAWDAPSLVSDVEIDARSRHVMRAENTNVQELKYVDALSWTQTDDALPFPLDLSDPAVALIVGSSDFVQALDQETLRITGLQPSRYQLRIDNDEVGTFDAEQLKAGINLALLDTPMKKQATHVFNLIQERENVHFGLWKRIVFPLQELPFQHKQQAIEAMTGLERDLLEEQHVAAQPRLHRYELRPMSIGNGALRLR